MHVAVSAERREKFVVCHDHCNTALTDFPRRNAEVCFCVFFSAAGEGIHLPPLCFRYVCVFLCRMQRAISVMLVLTGLTNLFRCCIIQMNIGHFFEGGELVFGLRYYDPGTAVFGGQYDRLGAGSLLQAL